MFEVDETLAVDTADGFGETESYALKTEILVDEEFDFTEICSTIAETEVAGPSSHQRADEVEIGQSDDVQLRLPSEMPVTSEWDDLSVYSGAPAIVPQVRHECTMVCMLSA